MSESNDPPPRDEPPPGSPFPESSLTPAPPPPAEPDAPPAPERPEAPPVAPPSSSWMEPSAPQAPPPAPVAPPPGLVSGDPLAGPPPTGAAPFPPGYTSPPPPGAGGAGHAPPPATAAFGAGAPAAGTFVLAGWWRRVGAALIDGLIIMVVAFVIMAPLGIGLFASGGEDDGSFIALIVGFIVAGLVIAAVALAYAPVMMGQTNGKTLGRMATGIRVVRADGRRITIGFAALREVAVKTLLIGTIAGSLTFGLASLLDVLWPLWDDENRALHDFVVNTRTVMD